MRFSSEYPSSPLHNGPIVLHKRCMEKLISVLPKNSRPACTGATVALLSKDSIRDLAVLRQIDHKNVMSLFCEPLREFSPWDLAGSLRGSSSDGDSSVRARYRSGGLKRSRRRVTAAVMPLFDGVGLDYQSGARAVLEAGETARDEWRDGMVERGEEEDSDDWKIDR